MLNVIFPIQTCPDDHYSPPSPRLYMYVRTFQWNSKETNHYSYARMYVLTGCATIHCVLCLSSEVKEVAGRHDVELAMIT